MAADEHPAPGDEPSGAMLLRVWRDRSGDRLIARFFDWTTEGAEETGRPTYAFGVDDITEKVRDWLLGLSAPDK